MRILPLFLLMSTIGICFQSCKKSEDIRPVTPRDLAVFKFQVMDVNYHCKDYQGKIVVKLKCIEYPLGTLEGHLLGQLTRDSIFISTTVPPGYLTKEATFSSEVDIYVDWMDKAWCQSMGMQINITNVQ